MTDQDFFQISGMNFFITGVANKKSIAYTVAKTLQSLGAHCSFSVQNSDQVNFVKQHFPGSLVWQVDVASSSDLLYLSEQLREHNVAFDGFLHSLAFAKFSSPLFHETTREDFLQATHISAFSLIELSNLLRPYLKRPSSIVTVSISTTKATSYGYMGPIKAMLESIVDYLAKSLAPQDIRVNAVGAGPLKTSASAGIPNYVENYLYSEQLTLRKKNLHTQEVANAIVYLLSPQSSGHNASVMRIDAGMSCNYFDQDIVLNANR